MLLGAFAFILAPILIREPGNRFPTAYQLDKSLFPFPSTHITLGQRLLLTLEEVMSALDGGSKKRRKTEEHEKVPTVVYKFWRETMTLLEEFRSDHKELILTAADGKRDYGGDKNDQRHERDNCCHDYRQ